ncbi:MAG: DUF6544 family protein [Nitriliruptoraceae bacterium]
MKPLLVVAGTLAGLFALGWAGLQVPPRSFPELDPAAATPTTVPLPDGLPAPVEGFYRERYGNEVPLIETAVISGRGTMRIAGLTLPVRWRFLHDTGEAYRHRIEATWFGLRILTIDERYLDDTARLELPFGVVEGANVDQGANLALWAEAVWMPSIWITDPRVRWEPLDQHTAVLVVPFGAEDETFVARFDPDTGLLRLLESMRFKGEDDDARTLWINEVVDWSQLDGQLQPVETALTWFDEGSPWAVLTTEQVSTGLDLTADVELNDEP